MTDQNPGSFLRKDGQMQSVCIPSLNLKPKSSLLSARPVTPLCLDGGGGRRWGLLVHEGTVERNPKGKSVPGELPFK